jgi:hypothetical protein
MEFRWIAIITLWTLLAGPMFDSPLGTSGSSEVRSNPAKAKLRSPAAPR